MKRILLPLIFFLPLFSDAQNDWAPVGAKWTYTISNEWTGEQTYKVMESVSDTIIDGIDCRKLFYNPVLSGCRVLNYVNYVYSDSNKFYFYNDTTHQFSVLYDFSLVPGDTHVVEMVYGNDMTMIVTDTSSVNINGVNLRAYEIQDISTPSSYYFPGKIIERIGSNFFFFPQHGICHGYMGGLRCYSDTAIDLYETGVVPYCDYSTSINERDLIDFEIFPNPTQDFLYLKNTTQNLSYKILDYTGRIILSGKTEKVPIAIGINVQTLSPGYYRVVFEDEVNRAFIKQ
ncbi:MAG: T9SS type A sorting domain-containing protein [Bacteroidia bacterium]